MVTLNIEAIAKGKKKSIAALAKGTGLHVTTIRRLYYASRTGLKRDQGSLTHLKLTHLQQLAKELEVTVGELIGNKGANQ